MCQTYHQAPEATQQQRRTISIDENTGIQALERCQPDRPMQPKKPRRIEFEYKRHGTLTLLANLDVVTGQLLAPTLKDTRREQDCCQHIQKLIESDPQAKEWVWSTDQLNIHQSES